MNSGQKIDHKWLINYYINAFLRLCKCLCVCVSVLGKLLYSICILIWLEAHWFFHTDRTTGGKNPNSSIELVDWPSSFGSACATGSTRVISHWDFHCISFRYVSDGIYHGRHTESLSMSIFGDIGGVLTRVDESMRCVSGVEFGDRFI